MKRFRIFAVIILFNSVFTLSGIYAAPPALSVSGTAPMVPTVSAIAPAQTTVSAPAVLPVAYYLDKVVQDPQIAYEETYNDVQFKGTKTSWYLERVGYNSSNQEISRVRVRLAREVIDASVPADTTAIHYLEPAPGNLVDAYLAKVSGKLHVETLYDETTGDAGQSIYDRNILYEYEDVAGTDVFSGLQSDKYREEFTWHVDTRDLTHAERIHTFSLKIKDLSGNVLHDENWAEGIGQPLTRLGYRKIADYNDKNVAISIVYTTWQDYGAKKIWNYDFSERSENGVLIQVTDTKTQNFESEVPVRFETTHQEMRYKILPGGRELIFEDYNIDVLTDPIPQNKFSNSYKFSLDADGNRTYAGTHSTGWAPNLQIKICEVKIDKFGNVLHMIEYVQSAAVFSWVEGLPWTRPATKEQEKNRLLNWIMKRHLSPEVLET